MRGKLLFVIALILTGCGTKPCTPVTIYHEVPIPIQCTAPWPPIPQFEGDAAIDMVKIKLYTIQLIEMGKICKGE